jgi:uncharacterized protein (UPF0332 family)
MTGDDRGDLVKHRVIQAQTALDDAKYLIDGKRSANSIVNRSYYAMFYAASAMLESVPGKIPSKHSGVIGVFDTEFVLKGILPKKLSKDFHQAFELRQVSDYQISRIISLEQAEEVWRNASDFVTLVRGQLNLLFPL